MNEQLDDLEVTISVDTTELEIATLKAQVQILEVRLHQEQTAYKAARNREERLTNFLHSIQKHPDYEYCMTFESNTAHKDLTGWERNPAMHDGDHGVAGGELYRNQQRPKELYWMRRKVES